MRQRGRDAPLLRVRIAAATVFKWLLMAMGARLVDRFDTDDTFVRKD
jgi:hypothetical protein